MRKGGERSPPFLFIASPLEHLQKFFAAKQPNPLFFKQTRPRIFEGVQVDVVYEVPDPQALPSTFFRVASTFPAHRQPTGASMKSCCCLTKIVGAIAIAVIVAGAAYGFGSLAVKPQALDKNVFVVEVPAPVVPTATGDTVAAAPAAAAPSVPFPELLAKADAALGQKYAKVCATCHSFNKGEAAKMGPNLYGIIGSKHAHMAGFSYSEAMKALGDKAWTFDELNAFLTDPRGRIAGTKMTFAGIKNDADRANVIAWLRSLADQPEPLPAK
jgi:cytochrome c